MNKYTELSDFEINKKVAENLKLNTIAYERIEIVLFDDMDATPFDPCNEPGQAMPIIIENRISIRNRHEGDWKAETEWRMPFESINKNPLRACMEVFLMMNDFMENENENE